MSTPKKALLPALAAWALALPLAAQPVPPTDGEITRVDKARARLTVRHGEIRHLDLPPMTMAFRVRDPRLLEALVAGDQVRFVAERVGGQYTITAIEKRP
jgi:Cu(I)/Ag(I) efflux system protein CusF